LPHIWGKTPNDGPWPSLLMTGPTPYKHYILHCTKQGNDAVIPGYRLDYNIFTITPQNNSLMKLVFPPEKVLWDKTPRRAFYLKQRRRCFAPFAVVCYD